MGNIFLPLYFFYSLGKTLAGYQNNYFKVNKKSTRQLDVEKFSSAKSPESIKSFHFRKNIDTQPEINYIQFTENN